jgi:hypothetical protein
MTLSWMTYSLIDPIVTLSIEEIQHNDILYKHLVILLSVIMSVTFSYYAECRYAEGH